MQEMKEEHESVLALALETVSEDHRAALQAVVRSCEEQYQEQHETALKHQAEVFSEQMQALTEQLLHENSSNNRARQLNSKESDLPGQIQTLRQTVKRASQTAVKLQAVYQTREVTFSAKMRTLSQVSDGTIRDGRIREILFFEVTHSFPCTGTQQKDFRRDQGTSGRRR
jgi:hypothetical protein